MMIQIEKKISQNFTVVKFFSILLVVLGHSPKPFNIWVVVTIGLLVFSYSSGFFTFIKYNGDFDKKLFLMKKVERLAINLAVIDIFLLILFLFRGETGIWTWQTLVNVLGLNGFLNWFRMPNPSPYGGGMWFFTLLLIFYLLYPLLEYINRKKEISYIFTIGYVLFAFYLHHRIQYGHALWLTSCGFIVGICFARNQVRLSIRLNIALFLFILILTVYCDSFLKIKYFNFFSIFFLSICMILSLHNISFPDFFVKAVSYLSNSTLEIYLIHSYLFITPTPYRIANFFISLILILIIAQILYRISSKIITLVKA